MRVSLRWEANQCWEAEKIKMLPQMHLGLLRLLLALFFTTFLNFECASAEENKWAWFAATSGINDWHLEKGTGTVAISGTRFSAELYVKDKNDNILAFRLVGTIKSGNIEVLADRLHSDDERRKLRGTYRRLRWTDSPGGREAILLTEVGHPEGLTIGL